MKTLANSRVLVTGAGGFIGSHLAERLTELGANTRAMVLYNSLGSRDWLDQSSLVDKMDVIFGDIRDNAFVREAMEGVDYVFHLAALIGIPYSYHAPESYVQTNVTGTLNVLQAARACKTRRVIHTSTSEAYGTALFAPITEEHPLQAQSPYAATKIAADKLVQSYNLSFDLDAVIVRPFNTFGPRQSARAVIPTIISQILAGKKKIALGSLHPTRDLNFVSNTVDAFLAAAVSPDAKGTEIHFGSNREISIGDLANLIAKLMDAKVTFHSESERIRPENSEVERLIADNSKAKRILKWEPKVSLEDGLKTTIAWMRDHLSMYKPDKYAV
ncbi:MAG: SDR family NAD(P)-dependent oxidoreductase [Chthoniobacterales bacterium]